MNPNVKNAQWLCTHGTEDGVLPYYTSKAQVKTLQDGGFDIDFKTYEKEHTIDREELDMLVKWIRKNSDK